jgi:hypothetical protein
VYYVCTSKEHSYTTGDWCMQRYWRCLFLRLVRSLVECSDIWLHVGKNCVEPLHHRADVANMALTCYSFVFISCYIVDLQ